MKSLRIDQTPSVLIIDDEQAILETLQASLEDEGFSIQTLNDGSKALQTIGALIPDLVLLDVFMPNINGLELLEKIKREYPAQSVIIISGYGTVSIAVDAIKKGARDFIEKPLNIEEILVKLSFLKEDSDLETQSSQSDFSDLNNFGIVGQSELFLEFIQQVRKTAQLKIPALIYGYQGTGKSLIATYLAYHHHHQEKPFVTIDCTRKNPLDNLQPIDGTIFFKNIQELDHENQKKALEFIAAHCPTVKIIVSALPNLFTRMQQGLFNSTLFYQLNNIPLEIVPLNKRRYDIPLLADYFLQHANKLSRKSALFHTRSIRILRNHHWIGNITQLRSIIECIVLALPHDQMIITPDILEASLPESTIPYAQEQSFTCFTSLDDATKHFEKKYLLYMLKKHRYNLEQLSESLKLPLVDLKTKMYKLDLLLKYDSPLQSSLSQ